MVPLIELIHARRMQLPNHKNELILCGFIENNMIKQLLRILFIPYCSDNYSFLENYCRKSSIQFFIYDPSDYASFVEGLKQYFLKTNFCFHAIIITNEKILYERLTSKYPKLVRYNSFNSIRTAKMTVCPICCSNNLMYQEGHQTCADCGMIFKKEYNY